MATTTPVSQNQRKRSLEEALERRFAVAKAELLQEQKKNKTTLVEEDGKEMSSTKAPIAPSSNLSLKKGNFPFSGPSSSQDVEENGEVYSKLSEPMHENLLPVDSKFSNKKGSMADKILHELLQGGDSAQKYMQGSRSIKFENWILLDNFVKGRLMSTGSQIRALKNLSKRSKRHMSMKLLKKSGVFELPQAMQKFDTFKPMHEMWKGYMNQLLKTSGKNQLAQCLIGADLHGALILVAECKVTSFTGVSGIMIRETAETFGLITQDNKFRVVPKKLSIFIFQVDCWKITLQGDKLTSRNSEYTRRREISRYSSFTIRKFRECCVFAHFLQEIESNC
ncbi:ribonuclease MRP protein subunit POP4 isoform X1 [Gossypium arboreum]|uniref:ribonuclease MRP protein subunit POP4 isoform X1 n=2 Tax=Gossypium arboreum TaxID=29729 RepID=UPI000819554C|nr:ribonuclease MRP protein subunit POP4 isoform X1 [Gossypium arboreum]